MYYYCHHHHNSFLLSVFKKVNKQLTKNDANKENSIVNRNMSAVCLQLILFEEPNRKQKKKLGLLVLKL